MNIINVKSGIIIVGKESIGKTTIIESCKTILNMIKEDEINKLVSEYREKNERFYYN